jgi:tetratricopeptide (TPR) repeat protein
MDETATIKNSEFITTSVRSLVMGLCDDGRLDDARAYLREREATLDGGDVDRLLECRNLLAMVERCAENFHAALLIHVDAYPLVESSGSDILKIRFHNGLGITCEQIAAREGQPGYNERALSEYATAARLLISIGDMEAAGDLENNIAMALCGLGRTAEAREHLAQARASFEGNKVKLAQVDETEARVYLREGNVREALYLVSGAIQVFIRHGEERLLAEAMRTQQKASADIAAEVSR